MGVVYTPEQVALGQYPQEGDHARLGEALLDVVQHSESILAGVVYGSTAVGIASRRSDVDFLAVCEEGSFVQGLAVVRAVKQQELAGGNFARLEEHFESDRPFEKTGQVDVQYLQHFKRIIETAPAWAVGDPLAYIGEIEPSTEELGQSVREYVRSKAGKFGKVAASTEVDYSDLQRALELPVAITRKTRQVAEAYFGDDAVTEDKMSMARIGEEILTHPQIIRRPGASDALEKHSELIRLDRECTEQLEIAIARDEVDSYAAWLNKSYLRAIEGAVVLSRSWQRVLDTLE